MRANGAMDPVSDVLRLVGLTGGVFMEADFSAPWSVLGQVSKEFCRAFMAPSERIVAFHYVVEGSVTVILDDGASWRVGAREVVLLPHNDVHVFASAGGLAPVSAAELIQPTGAQGVARIVHGGGGACTRMVCGFLGGNEGLHPLLANLPPVMTVALATLPTGDWMAATFEYVARTQSEGDAGAATAIAKASELMFVEVLRRHLGALPKEERGWLAGLRDEAVGRALVVMHATPSKDWTTEALAQEACLSRSAFAERFTTLVGEPPMRYLLNWRMMLAKQKLRDTQLMIAQIAFELGYESETSFTRAFRRETGLPPAAWRVENSPG
jgi:AraC-like DNA-binding protein